MPNVNKFYGVGHLGKDPEVRITQSGTSVANFSVGITMSEKQNGEWVKATEWLNCIAFGKQAEWLGEASKGDLCIFNGRMKTESYEKDGQKKYITKIICDDVQTVKKGTTEKSSDVRMTSNMPSVHDDLDDSEIPF